MNDKVTTPRLPSLEEGAAFRHESAAAPAHQERTATRKKAFALILLDALRGSRTYVEAYRAGRGAE